MTELIPFEPAPWARDAHSQTILGDLLPSPKLEKAGESWVVELDDGDRLVNRLTVGHSPFIAVLCHGLTGDANAGYISRLAKVLIAEGHTVCRMNHRNCGEGFGLSKYPYHAGRSDDLARIVFELKQKFPKKKVILIGYSMSGNAALLLSAAAIPPNGIQNPKEFESACVQHRWAQPDSVIAVNPPVELEKTTDRFLNNFNRIYQWNFVRVFHKMLKDLHHKQMLDQKFETHPLMTFKQFDDLYTAQRGGFGTAANYYRTCGAAQYLKNTNVPTIILTSKDDPIIHYTDIVQAELSSLIKIHVEEFGGHMGYLYKNKTPLGDNRWLDYAVHQFFKKLIL